MMQPDEVQRLIEKGLFNAHVYVEGDGSHFTALVILAEFTGKTRIQRQQMVYDTVREYLLNGSLHALSVKTLTPEEWQAIENQPDSHTGEK